jgi:flagellar biosynthesis protein FlhG
VDRQARNLREFVIRGQNRARVIAVTSGKGGVGKTSTSVNLGIALAAHDKRVIILDADLGLANVEVLLGLNSLYNLQHVIDGEKSIMEILVKGPGGIEIVPGSSGLAKMADLNASQRQNILNGLRELQDEADFIIIDTMAGIGQNVTSFVAAADEILLVTTPEPSALIDAYAMVKTVFARRENAVFRLMINMVANQQQAFAVMTHLSRVVQQYLGKSLLYVGYIVRDPHVSQGVMQTHPFLLRFPDSPASKCVEDLAVRLLNQKVQLETQRTGFFRRFAQSLGLASNG